MGLIPVSGRFLGEGKGSPLQYSCLKDPMDRGAWWATQSTESQRVRHDSAIKHKHRLGSSNNRTLFAHSSGGQKSKIKVSARLASPKACTWLPSRCVLTWSFSMCTCSQCLFCVQISSSYKDTSQNELYPKGLILTQLPLQRPYLQIQSYFEVMGVRASIYKFWRNTTEPTIRPSPFLWSG